MGLKDRFGRNLPMENVCLQSTNSEKLFGCLPVLRRGVHWGQM